MMLIRRFLELAKVGATSPAPSFCNAWVRQRLSMATGMQYSHGMLACNLRRKQPIDTRGSVLSADGLIVAPGEVGYVDAALH